jgi:hypothetical protein
MLLEGGTTGGDEGSKRTWRRLASYLARRKACYGRNWRQRADGRRRAGKDDGNKVA